jgi:hypothetical protein
MAMEGSLGNMTQEMFQIDRRKENERIKTIQKYYALYPGGR